MKKERERVVPVRGIKSPENNIGFLAVCEVIIPNIVWILLIFSGLCCMGTHTHTHIHTKYKLHSLVENGQTVVACLEGEKVTYFLLFTFKK